MRGKDLDYTKQFITQTEHNGDGSVTCHFSYQGQTGSVRTFSLWKGISLLFADFHSHHIPVGKIENFDYLLINYCTEGRYEVAFDDDRFVYMEKDSLSLDTKPARDRSFSPVGRYAGVEIIIDLSLMKSGLPPTFQDLEISPFRLSEKYCPNSKSFIAKAQDTIAAVYEKIILGYAPPLSYYRLATAELLHTLTVLPLPDARGRGEWITKGQSAIVSQVHERITGNLQQRFSIEKLAADYGISSSSLKNYFYTVYGQQISLYLREARMKEASRLLRDTNEKVSGVATAVGYENQSKFAAAFRCVIGDSPLEYRKRCRCGIL